MINYEEEVKKCYPDAFAWFYRDNFICIVNPIKIFGIKLPCWICKREIGKPQCKVGFYETFNCAWQSAYNNLKQQGKL